MRAIELDDSLADGHLALGYAHVVANAWDKAEDAYKRAIALDLQSLDAHFRLGSFIRSWDAYTSRWRRSKSQAVWIRYTRPRSPTWECHKASSAGRPKGWRLSAERWHYTPG